MYSSPHLVEVRERIRIDGKPLTKSKFVDYFQPIYSQFEKTKPEDGVFAMPNYYQFLTLFAYHVFLEERVIHSFYSN